MTPGLAGFIADGSDRQTWDDIVAAVLAALAAEFDVVPERARPGAPVRTPASRGRPGSTRSTGGCTRPGLTLEYVPGRGGSELRLSGTARRGRDRRGATQLVTGWQASRPHLLADLAGGPVGARIAEPGRAARAAPGRHHQHRDRRVPAAERGRQDRRPAAHRPAEPRRAAAVRAAGRPLPPRLAIAEVRGYLGQARRAARLIAAVPGVKPGAEPLFADALRAIGRRPGDYSNKVDADITAAMPAARAAAAILLRLLDTIEANVDGVLADTDTEFLHDLRVSVRRTRSALKLFGDALRPDREELAFFAAEFKWVGDLTTPTRDLDVHLLDFEDTARGLAAAKPDDLEPFRAYLEQRRRREFRALSRGLRSAQVHGTHSRMARQAEQDPAGQRDAGQRAELVPDELYEAAGGTAGLLAAERTRVAFAGSPSAARRSPRTRPPRPCMTCASAARSCGTRWSSSRRLHDPAGVREGGRGPQAAAGLPGRIPGHRGADRRDQGARRGDAGGARGAGGDAARDGRGHGRPRGAPAGGARRLRAAVRRVRRRGGAAPDVRAASGEVPHKCGFTRHTTSRAASGRPRRRSTSPTWRRKPGCAPCCGTWTRRARRASCSGSSRRSRAAAGRSSAASARSTTPSREQTSTTST